MELKISTFDNFHLLRKILSFYFNFSILLISVESLRPRGIGLIRLPFGKCTHKNFFNFCSNILLIQIIFFFFLTKILWVRTSSFSGVSDHRSGPYLPNLYIAGNKLYHKTQPVPDVSLPGQEKHFSGHAQLNPFTHMVAVGTNNDFGDSWGAGYALQGVNFLDLNLRKNYRQYANMPHLFTDGQHQPFQVIYSSEVPQTKKKPFLIVGNE